MLKPCDTAAVERGSRVVVSLRRDVAVGLLGLLGLAFGVRFREGMGEMVGEK